MRWMVSQMALFYLTGWNIWGNFDFITCNLVEIKQFIYVTQRKVEVSSTMYQNHQYFFIVVDLEHLRKHVHTCVPTESKFMLCFSYNPKFSVRV